MNVTTKQLKEPVALEDADSSPPDKDKWVDEMQKEMEYLHENEVWDLVDLPEGKRVIDQLVGFQAQSWIVWYSGKVKARLVAQGYSQKHGSDYDETFSSIWVQNDIMVHQTDVTTAFLNGELEEAARWFCVEGSRVQLEVKTSIPKVLEFCSGW